MGVFRTIFLNKHLVHASALGLALYAAWASKNMIEGYDYKGMKNIVGTTAIVTGANSGLGRETARSLADRGAKVILACRDLDKCERVRTNLIYETCNKCIECMHLDLSSLESVREFAKKVNEKERHVDLLVNNAGVMMCPKQKTQEGFEWHFGVNHLGHFLLTNLLLDKMIMSGPSRIVNVTDSAHWRGTINFEDLNFEQNYNASKAYSQSKLASILFTKELAQRLKGTAVNVYAVHPGMTNTKISRHMSFNNYKISQFLIAPFKWLLLSNVQKGTMTILFCALDPKVATSTGQYFSKKREIEPSAKACDMADAKRLWAISEAWTGLSSSS